MRGGSAMDKRQINVCSFHPRKCYYDGLVCPACEAESDFLKAKPKPKSNSHDDGCDSVEGGDRLGGEEGDSKGEKGSKGRGGNL